MNNKYILDKALELIDNNIETLLIKIDKTSGSSPRTLDAFMIVYNEDNNQKTMGTIGGGILEFEAVKDAFDFLTKKENHNKKYNLNPEASGGIGMVCGGSVDISFTYLNNNKDFINTLKKEIEDKEINVYIFGAGHVSFDLAEVLYKIGFNCIVIDDREEFANKERFPNAYKVFAEDYNNVFDKINITNKDYIIIVTRGHADDYIVEKKCSKNKCSLYWYDRK
ncbi:XdhC family protein [Brachyspira sp. G79]|uniref:XdhC family protein n=1 Tax=Brachyspira sp. G79 TaxID=1358104 RepID=UPI001F0AAFFF|nr:XdhC family protein [Brachyspira sp. G79]